MSVLIIIIFKIESFISFLTIKNAFMCARRYLKWTFEQMKLCSSRQNSEIVYRYRQQQWLCLFTFVYRLVFQFVRYDSKLLAYMICDYGYLENESYVHFLYWLGIALLCIPHIEELYFNANPDVIDFLHGAMLSQSTYKYAILEHINLTKIRKFGLFMVVTAIPGIFQNIFLWFLMVLKYVYVYKRDYGFETIYDYLLVSSMFISSIIFLIQVLTALNYFVLVLVICTVSCYVIVGILSSLKRHLNKKKLQNSNLNQFYEDYSFIMTYLFRLNKQLQWLMAILIIFMAPMNAWFTVWLIRKHSQMTFFLEIISISIILVQFMTIGYLHILCTWIVSPIKAPYKQLQSLICDTNFKKESTRERIRMSNAIFTIQTMHSYGFTYGPVGLISFTSFAKVCFLMKFKLKI